MRRRVEQTAQGLLAMGLVPGERLAIMAESCIEWVIVDLACAQSGSRPLRFRLNIPSTRCITF